MFQREVGLNPKLYARIVRFQHVLRTQHGTWSEIAQDCGYFDQPHLIRDFEEFTGQTPSGYSAAGSEMSSAFAQP